MKNRGPNQGNLAVGGCRVLIAFVAQWSTADGFCRWTSMKILLALFILATSVFGQDKPLTDEERTRQSLAVFTGTVISCGFDKRLKSVDYYKATLRVESIEKADSLLSTNTVTLIYFTGTKIEPKQKVKCWCIHWDYDGKRVLSIPWPSWVKPQ